MRRPLSGLAGSNRTIVAAVAVALVALHVYTVGHYFARPPAPGMSREVELGRAELDRSVTLRRRVLTLRAPDGRSATVVSADGPSTLLLEIDGRGTVLSRTSLELDLSESRDLAGRRLADGRIVVYQLAESLARIDIDASRGSYRREVVVAEARSFVHAEPFLVVETPDALLAMNASARGEPVTVTEAPLRGYDCDASPGGLTVVTVVDEPVDRFDVRLVEYGADLVRGREVTLIDDSREDSYARLQDVRVDGDRLSLLFSFRDEKYALNSLTVRRVDLATGSTLYERRTDVPILNSRYTFVEDDSDGPAFLMRYRTRYGYNIVVCTLTPEGSRLTELTKTRALSVPSAYLTIGGVDSLVFSDLDDTRRILFASGDPRLVAETSRWDAPVLARALASTAINLVMALFLGAVYLFFTSIPSYLAVAGIGRVFGGSRARNVGVFAAGTLVSTATKLAVTRFIVRETPNYHFRPAAIGDEPYIYLVLVAMSLFSFVLAARFVQSARSEERPVSGPFFQYLVIDALGYSLVFLLYAVTSVLIDKI
jgi:hypothetical protein